MTPVKMTPVKMAPVTMTPKPPRAGGWRILIVSGAALLLAGCGIVQSGHVGDGRAAAPASAPVYDEPAAPQERTQAQMAAAVRAQPRLLVCESRGEDYALCPGDTRGGVRLYRQIGRTPCTLNESWGFDSRGVWVDKGCVGEFFLAGDIGGNADQPDPAPQTQAAARPAPAPVPAPAPEPVRPPEPVRQPAPEPAPQPEPAPRAPVATAWTAPLGGTPRYGSSARDQAVGACQTHAASSMRGFGVETVLVDRVLTIKPAGDDGYEVAAYLKALYDEDAYEDFLDEQGTAPPEVIYVTCTARAGRVARFSYVDPR